MRSRGGRSFMRRLIATTIGSDMSPLTRCRASWWLRRAVSSGSVGRALSLTPSKGLGYAFCDLFFLPRGQIVQVYPVQQAFVDDLAHDIFLYLLRVRLDIRGTQ